MKHDKPYDIIIKRTIAAPRARVFRALVDPIDLMKWHLASEGWTTPHAKVDLKVGGTQNIGFRSPEGEGFDLIGTFTEIDEPKRLQYVMGEDRFVTYELEEVDGKTVLTLTFTAEMENSEEMQREGWTAMVDNLTALITI